MLRNRKIKLFCRPDFPIFYNRQTTIKCIIKRKWFFNPKPKPKLQKTQFKIRLHSIFIRYKPC